MKKVQGYIYVRALGQHEFEFYVEDDATDEEIEKQVENACNYYIDYYVEDGYEKKLQEVYVKR